MKNKIRDDAIIAIRPGQVLIWAYREGSTVSRYPVKVKKLEPHGALLHVFMGEKHPKPRRWSFRTNLPMGESVGHVGEVWLEFPAEKARLD